MPPPANARPRVAAFESRRCAAATRMFERAGCEAHVSPSMREAPVDDAREAIDFANELIAGQIDAVLLLTGVGAKMFVERVERNVDRQRLLDALSDVPTVVRGPKPRAALNDLGVKPTHLVPEPNTWRELLSTLDTQMPVANMTVGVQEYGVTNASLIAGLEARGARVRRVRVYEWALPEDTAPLEANLERLLNGDADVAAFTSAQQVDHLLGLADANDNRDALLKALRRVVVASIGPTTSERLRDRGIAVDLEASRGKLGTFVQEIAAQALVLAERKQQLATVLPATVLPATVLPATVRAMSP